MNAVVNVAIHSSQFPDRVRRDLLESLRTKRIAHKFHYDSVKQTQKWLALHQRYSPSRNDARCRAAYQRCFDAVAGTIKSPLVHVIGLGCGGGQKDTRLIQALKHKNRKIFYTPCDVAAAMVLTARQTALSVLSGKNCFPLVCDLQTAQALPAVFHQPAARGAARIITFFGMIPNFEPREILPKLASLVRPGDFLLFSANLAPGKDYAEGVKSILPQYDNPPTREWLLTFLVDLGIEKSDGELCFNIEASRDGLKRVIAHFKFKRSRRTGIEEASFEFKPGDTVRLFFSYRHTPERVRKMLHTYGLDVRQQWITESGEEGIFLCSGRPPGLP